MTNSAAHEDNTRSPGAERQRRYRERQKNRMRAVSIELRANEIDALVRRGHLVDASRDSADAIAEALYGFLDATLI